MLRATEGEGGQVEVLFITPPLPYHSLRPLLPTLLQI